MLHSGTLKIQPKQGCTITSEVVATKNLGDHLNNAFSDKEKMKQVGLFSNQVSDTYYISYALITYNIIISQTC